MFTTLLVIGIIVLVISIIGKIMGLAFKVAGVLFIIGLLIAAASFFFMR
jgi:hypothetical protein